MNPGAFPLKLDFAARISQANEVDFTVNSEAVAAVSLDHPEQNLRFIKGGLESVKGKWVGYLPANGRVNLQWDNDPESADGKVFYSSTGIVEARIGTGLSHQTHEITYRILQGKLKQLDLDVVGNGEIISVTGANVLAWKLVEDQLSVTLTEAIAKDSAITITSQSTLADLPTSITPLRIAPVGSIRHAGFIRAINKGSVRLEPSNLVGLTQLAPDKYPRAAIESRQSFVYRFPAANYSFEMKCDRIQPEVHISEVTLHRVSASERTIQSAIELDVREAAIREWDIQIPFDYSVVSVTGADIADYITSAVEPGDSISNVKVLFSSDITGRKLIRLMLEKSLTAESGQWTLPKLGFKGAKSIRGDLGISGDAGFRLSVTESASLAERPLSAFPGEAKHLQHYYRTRAPDWSATIETEVMEKSIQADVFHLYSLADGTAYGSILINYFITGAPASAFEFQLPEGLENVIAEGKDLRNQKIESDRLKVSLHQAVMGSFTLLITFEQDAAQSLAPGLIIPQEVSSESGYIQMVSPRQVTISEIPVADSPLLKLDHLELPPEFRLLSASPSLGIWQYNNRPFRARG